MGGSFHGGAPRDALWHPIDLHLRPTGLSRASLALVRRPGGDRFRVPGAAVHRVVCELGVCSAARSDPAAGAARRVLGPELRPGHGPSCRACGDLVSGGGLEATAAIRRAGRDLRWSAAWRDRDADRVPPRPRDPADVRNHADRTIPVAAGPAAVSGQRVGCNRCVVRRGPEPQQLS